MTGESVWKLIGKYGLPTVVALALGYVLIAEVRADQDVLKERAAAVIVEQGNLARGMLKLADKMGETQMLQEKVLLVMRVMCLQQSTTPADRRECVREQ